MQKKTFGATANEFVQSTVVRFIALPHVPNRVGMRVPIQSDASSVAHVADAASVGTVGDVASVGTVTERENATEIFESHVRSKNELC